MEERITSTINEYLTFKIDNELYAITVGCIKEVLGVPQITRVPRMPDFMNGVINLRGNIIPVLDLRLKFGLGKTPITVDTSIIVTEIENIFDDNEELSFTVGIFSDSVEKVVTIDSAFIEPPPKIGTNIDTSFVYGMGKVEDVFVMILDSNKILSETDLYTTKVREESLHE